MGKSIRTARASQGAMQAAETNELEERPKGTGGLVWLILAFHMLILLAIVLAFTPYTYSLDDIKKWMFLACGPLMMALAIGALMARQTPGLPKATGWALALLIGTLGISALNSRFRWIGYHETLMYFAGAGFFLSAMAIGSHRRTSEVFLKYLVGLLLLTNVIGFVLYDFFPGDAKLNAPVEWFFKWYYQGRPVNSSVGAQTLLYTFSQASSMRAMQSTILNRDFYAAFCTLYLPLAMLTMLDPGRTRHPYLWRTLGALAMIMSVVCVVYAQSKGEYIFGAFSLVLFLGVFYFVADLRKLRGPTIAALLAGIATLVATLLFLLSPILISRLKTVVTSVGSRAIIWQGSVNIFKDFPLLGGGPGTFRIYFPQYRAPDYFDHEISHVTLFSHNYLLDLLCEDGIVGLAFYLVFAGSLFWLAGRCVFRHPDARMRTMVLAALAGLVAMFGSNLSSPNGRWPIGASSLWTMLGFTMGMVLQCRGAAWDVHGEGTKAAGASWLGRQRMAVLGGLLAVSLAMFVAGSLAGKRYFDSQLEYLQGLRSMNPGDELLEANPRSQSGEMLMRRAKVSFEESLKIDPNGYQALYKLGSVNMRLCSVEGYRLGELVRSGGAGAADVRRQTMKVEMCLEQAIDAYSRLSALWPDYAELHYNYGLVFNSVADQLRYEEKHGLLEGMSKEIPRKLTEKTPEEWEALSLEHNVVMGKMSQKMEVALQLGRKYMDQGMQEEAVALLREASERYPTEEMLLQEYLSAAYQHKEVDAQLDALWKMWLINPMNDLFLNHLLNLAEQNSRDEWLTRAVAKLEEYNPVDWRVAAYRLEMYAKSREIEPMLLQLDRLLRCDGAKSKAIAVGCEAASQAGMRDAFNAILNEHGVPAVCEE